MRTDFKTLETAMKEAMDGNSALELRAQRALIALLENRLSSAERLFWSLQAEHNEGRGGTSSHNQPVPVAS